MHPVSKRRFMVLLGLMAAMQAPCPSWAQEGAVEVPVIEKPTPPLPTGPEAETLPPEVRPQPGEPGPGARQEQEEAEAAGEPVVEPAVQMRRTEALNFLINDGLMRPEDLTRATPVTRGELARLMVHAIGYNTTVISEFPFYRDVPREHADYAPIEVAREKRLIDYPDGHGFYQPDQPVRFSELYAAMGKALTAPALSASANETIVQSFADGNTLPMELTAPVVKMTNAHFFPPTPAERNRIRLNPDRAISALEIAPFIVRLMQVAGSHPEMAPEALAGIVAVLPAGLTMTVTPVASLFRSRLGVGDTVAFSLVSDAGPLIKGSRFRGRVESILDGNTYTIRLTEVRTVSEDQYYDTWVDLTIVFPEEDEKAFIVPGQVYEITTRQPVTIQTDSAPVPDIPPGQEKTDGPPEATAPDSP